MKDNKLQAVTKLFENKEIRSIWDEEKEEYYFSVVDVISALTDSKRPSKYWTDLKDKLAIEGSSLSGKIGKLKMKDKNGRNYPTEVLDTQGIFRLIESVPSPNAEPLKNWLAQLGKERIDEVFDPEIAIKRAVTYYRNRGYNDAWIEARLKGTLNRNKLTDVWKEGGIHSNYEYAILTNEIYKTWSGMTDKEYKSFKGIRKESLRDNMSDIEVALTDLSEITTRELSKKNKPIGLEENKKTARVGGTAAKVARNYIEEQLGETIISKENSINYQYVNNKDKSLIEEKEETIT